MTSPPETRTSAHRPPDQRAPDIRPDRDPQGPADVQVPTAPPAEVDAGASWTTGQRARLILVLGVLVALGPLTIDLYLPALPTITTELVATQSQVQLTLTGLLAGLALGQLVLGPLSDRYGRKRPLVVGVVVHAVASVLCALSPSIEVLTAARVLQGVASAASAVVALAVVRDLFSGMAAARTLSRLTLVMGAAPIVAPTLGSWLLVHTSWRGVFVVLAGAAVILVVVALVAMPETLPVERRRRGGAGQVVRTYGSLLRDRRFLGLVLVAGLSFSIMFAYISGSSFVLQDTYGLDQQQYGYAFGGGALFLIAATQLNPVLIQRFSPVQVLGTALATTTATTGALLAVVVTGFGGLWGVLVPLWATLGAVGFILPNGPALALTRHGKAAGTAAAVLGCMQFGIGALVAPLVGEVGGGGAVGMAVVMLGASVAAVVVLLAVVQPRTLDQEPAARAVATEPAAA